MRTTALFVLGILMLAGCAHEGNERLLTPEEKARMIEAAEAHEATSAGEPSIAPQRVGCSPNRVTRYEARDPNYRGTDGFGSRNCGAGGN